MRRPRLTARVAKVKIIKIYYVYTHAEDFEAKHIS